MKKWRDDHPLEFLCSSLYSNLQRRCNGKVPHHNKKLWVGLPYCSISEFKKWFFENKDKIEIIHKQHLASGKNRSCSVSIHRIDSSQGYFPNNMDIITQSQNSKIAALKRWNKK